MCDSEDEMLFSSAVTYYIVESARKKRKYSAHPINTHRHVFGEFHHLYKELRQHPAKFFEYMRMEIETFEYISLLISDRIQKRWSNCHSRPILTEERLMITIR